MEQSSLSWWQFFPESSSHLFLFLFFSFFLFHTFSISRYNLSATEFSHSVSQDPLSSSGVSKKLSCFDILPMMTRVTSLHSEPHVSIVSCAKTTSEIADMRPSEWGYKEWGYEGEHGHRVMIMDDVTKQQRTDDFVAAAGAGNLEKVTEMLDDDQCVSHF